MIVTYDGSIEVHGDLSKGTHMGLLVPVPKGYEPCVAKPTLWNDAIEASALRLYERGRWVTAPHDCEFERYAVCINVDTLRDWYRQQIAIRDRERAMLIDKLEQVGGKL
jgi:hypothetical protein